VQVLLPKKNCYFCLWIIVVLIKRITWLISKRKTQAGRRQTLQTKAREKKKAEVANTETSEVYSLVTLISFTVLRLLTLKRTKLQASPVGPLFAPAPCLQLCCGVGLSLPSSKSNGSRGLWPSKIPARWVSGDDGYGAGLEKQVRISAEDSGPLPMSLSTCPQPQILSG
jgi:hypothetical protein